jgi:photosystem II stability/assembly factor-like uncharacterized protein
VYALAVDSSNSAILWAGIPNALLRSADGGQTWTNVMPDLDYATVRAVVLDAKRPDVVMAGTTRDGVRRSEDGGRTWTGPGSAFWALDVTGIATDADAPETVWVATSAGMWRTTDGGTTWALKSTGLTNRSVNCVVADPTSRMLYACTGDGVFRSADGSENWLKHQSGLSTDTRIIGLALDPANPKVVHARDGHWVYRSGDGGINWKRSEADLESSGTVNGLFALGVAPGEPTAVFANVYRHLWKSVDGATTFMKIGTGLPLARVQTLVSDAGGATLWLGTEGQGVWRLDTGKR